MNDAERHRDGIVVSGLATPIKKAVMQAILETVGLPNMTGEDFQFLAHIDNWGHSLLSRYRKELNDTPGWPGSPPAPPQAQASERPDAPPAWGGPAHEDKPAIHVHPEADATGIAASQRSGLASFFNAADTAGPDMSSGENDGPVSAVVEGDEPEAPALNTFEPPPDYTALERASRLDDEVRSEIGR